MTKMISQVSKQRIFEDDQMDDPLHFVVSDDKFELLELVVDKIKKQEVGESFVVNLVTKMTEEEKELYSGINVVDKDEVIYDLGLVGELDTVEEETL
jgi:hypothetical protein